MADRKKAIIVLNYAHSTLGFPLKATAVVVVVVNVIALDDGEGIG